ncbi:MAG: hypothetical protein LBV67_11915 [Streptococcaceae bacterium]|nr:hypothetical protein [Streptococcaceae bacterium]
MAEMQNRKILSLNEVLNLDRRPTLQEMVDLAVNSIEDYTKYLFEKGIIKYVPESGSVENYNLDENDISDYYCPSGDIIILLKNDEIGEGETCECVWDEYIKTDEYRLNESYLESYDSGEYNKLLEYNGKEYIYSYSMDSCGYLFYHIIPLKNNEDLLSSISTVSVNS